MASVIRVQDVINEMDTLSSEHHAYLNRQTGELVTLGNEEIRAVEEEHDLGDYPDWQQEVIRNTSQVLNSNDYLMLPSTFDIHEYSIMKQFCDEIEDAEFSNELLVQIRGSGTFRRFKRALHRYHIAEDWYRYRHKALEDIAIAWLEENGIEYELSEDQLVAGLVQI